MPPAPFEIDHIDHLVLTTKDLAACLDFYVPPLGMKHVETGGRHSLHFGWQKINIHTRPGEFQPAAATPTPGALDLCFIIRGDLDAVQASLEASPYKPLTGKTPRTGALGPIQSLYLRDPDGNLVELSCYGE